jgi:hypothetical protein
MTRSIKGFFGMMIWNRRELTLLDPREIGDPTPLIFEKTQIEPRYIRLERIPLTSFASVFGFRICDLEFASLWFSPK